jgi:hypothetical protein
MGGRFLVYMLELDYSWSVQFYFLLLLIAIFIGMREFYISTRNSSLVTNLKVGAQVGAIFSLLTTVFTYVFYRFVDLQFFAFMISERLEAAQQAGASAEDVEKYRGNLEMVFNAGTQSMATLIGFMFLTFVYSALVALLLTKVPFFGRRFN